MIGHHLTTDFYEEFRGPGFAWDPEEPTGNCIAIDELGNATVPLYNWPNSEVGAGTVTGNYLWDHCDLIDEAEARRIHPALFEHLDRREV